MAMLLIEPNKLSYIQKQFNQAFPFLKLEFYKHVPHSGNIRSLKLPLEEDYLITRFSKKQTSLLINENIPICLMEQLFLARFGVSVQVMRKSGNSWLETRMTRQWTLKRQNEEGEELSTLKYIKK